MLTLLTEEQLAQVPEELRSVVSALQEEAQKAAPAVEKAVELERQNQALTTKTTELEKRLNEGAAQPPAGTEEDKDKDKDKVFVTRAEFDELQKQQAETKKRERAEAVRAKVLAAEGKGLLPGYLTLVTASEDEAEVKASVVKVGEQMAEDLKAAKLQVADVGGGSPADQTDAGTNVGDDVVKQPSTALIKDGLAAKRSRR